MSRIQRVALALLSLPFLALPVFAQNSGYNLRTIVIGETGVNLTFNYLLEERSTVTVLLQDNDASTLQTLTITAPNGQSCTGQSCTNHIMAALETGPFVVTVVGQALPGQTQTVYLECRGPGGLTATSGCSIGGGGDGGGDAGSTPAPGADANAASNSATAAGASSSGAVGSSISAALGQRNGGSNIQASRSNIFLSTQGQDSPLSAWVALTGRSFSGTLDGSGAELTFGIDTELESGTVIGFAASYGDYTITSGGVQFETEAWAFGPYASFALGTNAEMNAYILGAKPEYTSGGVSYDTDRVMAGLDAEFGFTLGQTLATGYVGVSGFTEDLPAAAPGGARTVSQAAASFGTRFDFTPDAAVRPYVSIGADLIRFDNGFTSTNSASPRVGAGLTADVGGGELRLDLLGNEIFDGARSVSVSATFRMTF